ncbi:hypothetical protein LBMAG52_28370 [Planctomycetia bacterium]|nr:hypothetical protein LBMAG52_28370 [Planctomycetia bacterium]
MVELLVVIAIIGMLIALLLYAGRDLQELLELPRTSKSPHQKRLDAFFEQLQEMYGSKWSRKITS